MSPTWSTLDVHISANKCTMIFSIAGEPLFVAPINDNNAAFLSGSTEEIMEHAHRSISTLPPNQHLWHRRFAHHSYDVIAKMVKDKLVTGLCINAPSKPDPICEPCLAGKMNAHPFPSSKNCAANPLDLIHSDLHGPF